MKLLVDMNLSPRWAGYLREQGFDAEHWSQVGPANASDRQIMASAQGVGATILTHDLDFGAMLAAGGARSPSVVQIRASDLSVEAIGRPVVAALRQQAAALREGALITVEPGRTRIILLPLRRP